jgi:citrate synthase
LSDQRSDFVTAAQAAAILGVRTATIYAYASRGLLGGTAQGPGKKARYLRSAVERLQVKAAARSGHAAVAAAALRWGEPVLDSSITRLSPRGPVYRGQRATDLVGQSFESVAELLWKRPVDWSGLASRVVTTARRPSVHALIQVMAALAPLLRGRAGGARKEVELEAVEVGCAAVIRRLACSAGPAEALAERQGSIAGALGASLRGRVLTAEEKGLLDAGLVLIADHELNASTFAARIATAAGARWPEALLAALATASGVRHAAACDGAERLWAEVRKARQPGSWLEARINEGSALDGFDAGAYPDGDPRGERLIALTRPRLPAGQRARLDALLVAVRGQSGQFPSVDFGLVLLAQTLGFPPGSATLVFVLGRTAGWVAHIEEQAASGALIRPRARYVGD